MSDADQIDLYLRRVHRGGGTTSHVLRLAARYGLMLAVAALMLGPFLWLVYLSLRMQGNIYEWPKSAAEFSLQGYRTVLRDFPILSALKNSVIVSTLSVLITVAVASLAAYPLARYDFYGKRAISMLILSTLMIPFQLYMIPLFLQVNGLLQWARLTLKTDFSLLMVVLPFAASVVGIFLIKQYYASVPRDLEEAARVDGAGEFRMWWQVMFPLTKPAVATLAIFTFVGTWSAFLWPLILLQDESQQTTPVVLATLTGAFVDRISSLAAGSVLAIAPVIVFFLLLQRYFLGGMTVGAVKG